MHSISWQLDVLVWIYFHLPELGLAAAVGAVVLWARRRRRLPDRRGRTD